MSDTDLFGQREGAITDAERKRRARRLAGRPSGYAALPGSGPQGETCKTCRHYTVKHSHNGTYRKCGLMERLWTNGSATDILARSPACRRWEAEEPAP